MWLCVQHHVEFQKDRIELYVLVKIFLKSFLDEIYSLFTVEFITICQYFNAKLCYYKIIKE